MGGESPADRGRIWRRLKDDRLLRQLEEHLLQVSSNPSPGAVTPQELVFRSTPREHQDDSPEPRRRARQLRTDEEKALVERYCVVRNVRTVAGEFRLSRTTVARLLKKHGVHTARRLTEAQIDTAVELYQRGTSSAAIGAQLGFDDHTILKALRGRSVAIRPAVSQRLMRTVGTGEQRRSRGSAIDR